MLVAKLVEKRLVVDQFLNVTTRFVTAFLALRFSLGHNAYSLLVFGEWTSITLNSDQILLLSLLTLRLQSSWLLDSFDILLFHSNV